jgi:hypothetical protein
MSQEFTLIVKLPPENTLLRDLAVTSLAYIGEYGTVQGVQVDFLRNMVKISAKTRQIALDPFKSLYQEAANIADQKATKIRLGILRNDQQILSKLLKREVRGFTYLDVVGDFLHAYSTMNFDLFSLSRVEVSDEGVKLGQGDFVAINPLIGERYEHGLEFWRLNYRRKLQIRLDETWYALILAGFALTVASFIENDLLIIYPPEDFIHMARPPSKIFEVLKVLGKLKGFHKKVCEIAFGEWCPIEPFPAFILLISLNLVEGAEDREALYMLNYSLPLAFCKLRRTVNVFTMVEKRRAELFDVLKFATKLMMREAAKERLQLLRELANIARRTLHLGGGFAKQRKGEADFTVYNRFCMLLFQAIQGAYSPYEVVYYGSRYGLISKELAEGIIRALT